MGLTSNGYPVVSSPDQLGRLTPSAADLPIDRLREQLKADGYLWLRGFFPREENRMRLSTDIRYQRIRDEIDARWQNHWTLDDML